MWSKASKQYTRCRLHGGASTGPKTVDGLERCRRTRWKHGEYSAEERARRRAHRLIIKNNLAEDRLSLEQLRRMVRLYLKLQERAEREALPTVRVMLDPSFYSEDKGSSRPPDGHVVFLDESLTAKK